MTEMRELHRRASERFGAYVQAVGDDQWGRPTPCTEWDVRALVNHLVYEQRWVAPLVQGKTIADVGDSLEGDLLVHGWDLARAIGADETMDPDLAAVVLERWQPQEPWLRGSGVVGPRVEVPPDASVQAKLIGFFGRRP